LKKELESGTKLVKRGIHQTQERLCAIHGPNKVYCLHEPHVDCVRKVKSATPTEYGTKVLISVDSPGEDTLGRELTVEAAVLLAWGRAVAWTYGDSRSTRLRQP
jgi:hypothetical protein